MNIEQQIEYVRRELDAMRAVLATLDAMDAMRAVLATLEAIVDRDDKDLAMLVARLARELEKVSPGNDKATAALDYLRRHSLHGSPLRQQSEDPS